MSEVLTHLGSSLGTIGFVATLYLISYPINALAFKVLYRNTEE